MFFPNTIELGLDHDLFYIMYSGLIFVKIAINLFLLKSQGIASDSQGVKSFNLCLLIYQARF